MSYFRLPSRGNRFYGNFRRYGGPSLLALKAEGEGRATTDEDVAREIHQRYVKYYLDDKRRIHLGLSRFIKLGDAVETYLVARARKRDGAKGVTLEKYALDFQNRIIAYFGVNTPLAKIQERQVAAYVASRRRQISRKGGTVSDGSIRRELSVLSSLFEFAIRQQWLLENPVHRHGFPPKGDPNPTFLEPSEAWALLEAAGEDSYPFARAFLGVMLYCGLRQTEARGLEALDVDRDQGVIRVAENAYRSVRDGGIKNQRCIREVPLWPDLIEWLPARIGSLPLFPSPRNDSIPLARNPQRMFDRLVERAGITGKRITPHTLRHTWCAMRLQTLDHGAPVAPYTVMHEGGWSSLRMIEAVYGHLPRHRLRLAELTYRPEAVAHAQTA